MLVLSEPSVDMPPAPGATEQSRCMCGEGDLTEAPGGPRSGFHSGCWQIHTFSPVLSIAVGLSFLAFEMVVGFGIYDFLILFLLYILILF